VKRTVPDPGPVRLIAFDGPAGLQTAAIQDIKGFRTYLHNCAMKPGANSMIIINETTSLCTIIPVSQKLLW